MALLPQVVNEANKKTFVGFEGSSASFLIAEWWRASTQAFFLLLVPDASYLERFESELAYYLGESAKILRFPPYDGLPYRHLSPHRDIQAERVATLTRLLENNESGLVLTTGDALLSPTIDPENLIDRQIWLKKGDSIDREAIVQRLSDWGYQKKPFG